MNAVSFRSHLVTSILTFELVHRNRNREKNQSADFDADERKRLSHGACHRARIRTQTISFTATTSGSHKEETHITKRGMSLYIICSNSDRKAKTDTGSDLDDSSAWASYE